MRDFIHELTERGYQKKKVALMENGTWAPVAAKKMRAMLDGSRELTYAEQVVTLRSAMNEESRAAIIALRLICYIKRTPSGDTDSKNDGMKGEFVMSIVYVTQENFENEVLKSDKPVLLDFYADWCGPCRMIAPILEEIAREHEEYKICKVNVDEVPSLAMQFEVMSIPTLLVFKNGEVTATSMGAKPKAQILAMLA